MSDQVITVTWRRGTLNPDRCSNHTVACGNVNNYGAQSITERVSDIITQKILQLSFFQGLGNVLDVTLAVLSYDTQDRHSRCPRSVGSDRLWADTV